MADTVGAMYVKVISDTKGLKKEIEKAGEESGGLYGRKWHKGVAKEINKRQFTKALEGEMKASAGRTARAYSAELARGIKSPKVAFGLDPKSMERMKALAKQMGLDFGAEMADNSWDEKRFAALFERSLADRKKKQDRYLAWQARTEAKYTAMSAKARESAEKALQRDRMEFERKWRKEFDKTNRESAAQLRRAWAGIGGVSDQMNRAARSMQDATRNLRVSMSRDTEKLTALWKRMAEQGQKKIKLELDRSAYNRMISGLRSLDIYLKGVGRRGGIWASALVAPLRLASGAARAFSGALKLPFKALENLGGMFTKMGNIIPKMFTGKLSGVGQMLGGLYSSLGKFTSSFGAFFQKALSTPMGAALSAAVALTAGFKVLNVVLGMMVALVNSAAGVLTMLASAAYAAAANLVLLVPMAGALGIGLAGVAVGGMDAFKSIGLLAKAMNEADPKKRAEAFKEYEKSLKNLGKNARAFVAATKPLIKQFGELKKAAGEALFDGMADALKAAQPMIDALKDGLEVAAGAVGNVIDKFLRLGKDTQFVKDLGVMFKGVGVIIEDLGGAMVDVFAGLNSFFAAIQPIVEKFTGAIAKAAEGFREWAQSEEGRAKIKAWFEKAYEVGGKVWAIIKEVALAFHDLFTAGMNSETTTGLLDSILGKVQDFRKFIGEAAADGRLEEWFQQAKDTAKALWDAIVLIGGALQSLNTEENRAWLISLITGIGKVIKFLIDVSKIAAIAFKPLGMILSGIFSIIALGVSTAARLADQFNRLTQTNPFAALADKTKGFRDAVKGAFDWVGRLIGNLGRIRFPSIPSGLTALAGKFFAAGGITNGPSIAGEAGPEMVIPLTRPLSQIDPSVRQIAAMIRGQSTDRMLVPNQSGPMKVVNNDIKVYAASTDPSAVAEQVVNRSVAMAQ